MYDRLYAVGRRILRDGYAAEDAVQEALIRGVARPPFLARSGPIRGMDASAC